MTLATLQQLRSFNDGEHPLNLEPGQIGFNMAYSEIDTAYADANMYMYVGNGSDVRMDEGGQVLVSGGLANKGWVRYRMRNVSVRGDTIYGDLTVNGSKLKVESTSAVQAELVIPVAETQGALNTSGTETGSVRWNASTSVLQAWNGVKWDSTSKVSVGDTAPANPSNGDMWVDPGPPVRTYIYVDTGSTPATWVLASSSTGGTALQPGNGVSPNALNQIELIDSNVY